MTREDLKKYYYSQEWIKEQIERYEEQRSIVQRLSANLDGLPKGQNKSNYALENLMDKYNELLSKLVKQQEKQNQIIDQLMLVEVPYRNILTKRYIEGKSLVIVAAEMDYTYEHIKHLNGIALMKFDEAEKR